MNQGSEKYRKYLAGIMKYAGIIMSLIYIAAGVAVLLNSDPVFRLPRHYAVPIGFCLILYGVFRGHRLYQKHF